MAIENPDHQFRLVMILWGGNYRGEQPFYSAPQKNLLDVIMLAKQIKAQSALHSQVRSYKIQEQMGTAEFPAWRELDHSDWCNL